MPDAVLAPPLSAVSPPPRDPRAIDGVLHLHAHPLHAVAPDLAESVSSLARWSRFPVWSVNTRLGFPPGLERLRFRAVVLHYTLFYSALASFTPPFRRWLGRGGNGYLIALFQDEQAYTRERFELCREYGVSAVYTCLQPEDGERVYGTYTDVPRVVSYHPGYVSERLVAAAERFGKDDAERRIDVGYRGRRLPEHWGEAAAEKWQIAVEFERRAQGRGLTLDISIDEAKRIYGDRWYRFIADCRGMLGTESGASRFDIEGVVPAEAQELGRASAGVVRKTTPVSYRTISPRHLEAAAFGVCQILYEGAYANVLRPMVHYIPLRKDFANFDEVLERFADDRLRGELARNARRDLVDSGDLSYARLVHEIDAELEAAGVEGTADRDAVARVLYPAKPVRRARAAALGLRHAQFPGRARVGAALRRATGR